MIKLYCSSYFYLIFIQTKPILMDYKMTICCHLKIKFCIEVQHVCPVGVCHHSPHQNPSQHRASRKPCESIFCLSLDTSPAFLLLHDPQLQLGRLSYSLIHMPDPSIKGHLTTHLLFKSCFFLQCSKHIPYTDTGAEVEGRMNGEID